MGGTERDAETRRDQSLGSLDSPGVLEHVRQSREQFVHVPPRPTSVGAPRIRRRPGAPRIHRRASTSTPCGPSLQHPRVAGLVAALVVDLAETIEIDRDEGEVAAELDLGPDAIVNAARFGNPVRPSFSWDRRSCRSPSLRAAFSIR